MGVSKIFVGRGGENKGAHWKSEYLIRNKFRLMMC